MTDRTAASGRVRGQRGEGLIESLLSIVILSVVVAATYGGLQVALGSSVQQRESAVAGAMLRNAAETLLGPDSEYVELAGCKGHGDYGDLPEQDGYGTVEATITFIEPPVPGEQKAFRAESAVAAQSSGGCPEVDPGLQQIELAVSTPSGRPETMQIIKRRR